MADVYGAHPGPIKQPVPDRVNDRRDVAERHFGRTPGLSRNSVSRVSGSSALKGSSTGSIAASVASAAVPVFERRWFRDLVADPDPEGKLHRLASQGREVKGRSGT